VLSPSVSIIRLVFCLEIFSLISVTHIEDGYRESNHSKPDDGAIKVGSSFEAGANQILDQVETEELTDSRLWIRHKELALHFHLSLEITYSRVYIGWV